jgi:hypothetical protein
MTIMLTWTAAMTLPGTYVPEAEAANQYLWVSVEANPDGTNAFIGSQVVEIVVNDPAINRLDEDYGMPDVSIDGKKVIMAQGVDGSWYAYVADNVSSATTDAVYATDTTGTTLAVDHSNHGGETGGESGAGTIIWPAGGLGGDFGKICGAGTNLFYDPDNTSTDSSNNSTVLSASEGQGVWLPYIMNGTLITPGTLSIHVSGVNDGFTGRYGMKSTGTTLHIEHTDGGMGIGQQGTAAWTKTTATYDCQTSKEGHRAGAGASGVNATDHRLNGVVREPRELANGTTTGNFGNINLGPNMWPLVQTFDFTVDAEHQVTYARGSGDENVTMCYCDPKEVETFDRTDDLGRHTYGLKHEIGITIQDFKLNVDPTDEDSWTFDTKGKQAYYQLFDENGANSTATGVHSAANAEAYVLAVAQDSNQLGDNWGDSNLVSISRNPASLGNALDWQDNDDQILSSCSDGLCTVLGIETTATQMMTFTETGANTGVFRNWDESNKANMIIKSTAPRGATATFSYDNDHTILHEPVFGSVTFDTDSWTSGSNAVVYIDDNDMNPDDRNEDKLKVNSNGTIVPAIKIGSPITLKYLDSVGILKSGVALDTIDDNIANAGGDSYTYCSSDYAAGKAGYSSCIEKYSERAMIANAQDAAFHLQHHDVLKLTWNSSAGGTTVQTLKDLIGNANGSAAFTYINYDFRSIKGSNNTIFVNVTFSDNQSPPNSFLTVDGNAAISDNDPERQNQRMKKGTSGFYLLNAPSNGTDQADSGRITDVWGKMTMSDPLVAWVNFSDSGASGDSTNTIATLATGKTFPIVLDVMTFGQSGDGVVQSDRHHNAIYRLEALETSLDSGEFKSKIEMRMLTQLNVNDSGTYNGTKVIHKNPIIVIHQDSTDEDEVRVNYMDLGADGVETQVADQLAAPTHSGVVELDSDSYKEADTVTITLTDKDLNYDKDLLDVFTVVSTTGDGAYDQVGKAGYGQNSEGDNFGRMLDVTFDDTTWVKGGEGSCTAPYDGSGNDGLGASGFTLLETGTNTGVFTGSFQIPSKYCSGSSFATTLGTDIEVNYVDYRDASGEIIEVGDGGGVRANTGSVSLDRTVYPVPFGVVGDFSSETAKSTPNGRSLFPIHSQGINDSTLDAASETLGAGDLVIHVRIDDPDYDLSAAGEDTIASNTTSDSNRGPIKIYVSRGANQVQLATAGGSMAVDGLITETLTNPGNTLNKGTREMGPIAETAPDSGVFELDFTVRYTDGPSSADCPSTTDNWTPTDGTSNEDGTTASVNAETTRFATAASSGDYCILQGDVLTVEYSDPSDAGGNAGVAYDSATFDLRNGVLQSDKSVYIIGSDIIMTLIEPDLNLESDESETWDLDLIEWDSDAATVSMGDSDSVQATFDPEPSDFRETGDNTGIFQIVIEVPNAISGTFLDRGELIELEYTDWGPSGADWVGDDSLDVNLDVYTSNFGATIELDQKVYTWTDKVYVTIVAPDHNFDSGLVDKIGDTDADPLIVQTRTQKLTGYNLAETGTDTGIFSGEVILKGFSHDADGDPGTGTNGYDVTGVATASGSGPTDGVLKAENDDGLTVSYEYNEDEVVVGSALVRWNIGEAQWLESSYPATGTGVVRVIDPDMNWDPENVDNFDVDVWSDSDAGGISLTLTETNEATGIFEGSVTFTTDDESAGHRLRAAEGDTVTASYEDNTLPDPYTRSDELDITGTAIIGTIVPPLERAPASNARVVDSFGNSLNEVSVDQQVQVESDLVNGQDREQAFAYLVQVKDGNGVTVSLAWITGQLAAGQSFSPALSWIPDASGTYEATVFVWESVDNPTALSDTTSVSIRVV